MVSYGRRVPENNRHSGDDMRVNRREMRVLQGITGCSKRILSSSPLSIFDVLITSIT